ncbi:hypothetical protein BDY24DRAFT_377771 [Mrakia frigida]|uniref:PUB domain-containing protein n=1 Tax=Mrakia frigida TaxID=29902 RepID=UPI003FCC0860
MSSPPTATPSSPRLSRSEIANANALAAQARQLSSFSSSFATSEAQKLAANRRAKEAELDRLIERGVIGPNHYAEAEKVISITIKICENIIENPSDPKYRTIKATSKVLKNNIIDIKGGQELFVALGFRTVTIEFLQNWTFPIASKLNGLDRLEVLQIGVELLRVKEVETKKRAEKATQIRQTAKEEQEARRLEAVAGIEHDRLKVRERAAREAAARRGPAAQPASPTRTTTSRFNVDDDDEKGTYEEWDGEGNRLA